MNNANILFLNSTDQNEIQTLEQEVKRKVKTVFGTVVYNTALKYKTDFINSVNAQTADDFNILIINDDVSTYELNTIKQNISYNTEIISKPRSMSIAETRVFLIEQAKCRGYDLLILGDFDDVFQENRISAIINHFHDDYGFYYNTLCTMDGTAVFKELPEICEDISDILQGNFLGLSTTALNLTKLENAFIHSLYECNIPIFDWYLYARLLLNGKRGLYVKETVTFYRIHENNIAGILTKNDVNIKKEILVKLNLYLLLKKYFPLIEKLYWQYYDLQNENYELYVNPRPKGFWWNNLQINNWEEK